MMGGGMTTGGGATTAGGGLGGSAPRTAIAIWGELAAAKA